MLYIWSFWNIFVFRVTRLNYLTTFRNINSRINDRTDISSIPAHISQICCRCKESEFVRFQFSHMSRPVAFRNHRTRMRCDLFWIYNLLYFRTHPRPCVQFLPVPSYRPSCRFLVTTLHRRRCMKQKWFEGRCHRQVLQYTVSHMCLDFDFMNRPQLL